MKQALFFFVRPTTPPALSSLQVCPVESAWVSVVLPKLESVDVERLSGGKTGARAHERAAAAASAASLGPAGDGQADGSAAGGDRRNTDAAVDAARARYLARKKAQKGGK
jgi:ATP-dependent RNA helicase DHX8/PRP22